MSSAMGYQPTLSTDMGSLQEQITSTKEGFTTSIQAVYVPADDLTNPALAMTFAHLDATTVLSRGLAAKAMSPFLRLVDPDLTLSPTIMAMIESASEGLLEGKIPIRTQDGSGGAYFMLHPSGETTVAVFKPQDEERNAVNNHQGQLSRSDSERRLKRGTTVGEGALREVAAYLLDHPRIKPRADGDIGPGFSGVPPTVMVECLHKSFHHPDGFDGGQQNIKVGSLQVFMPSDGSCDNWGSNGFPVDEVHKIAVLDLRTANADRHAGNILFRRSKDYSYELIPIDHGYSLPESFEDLTFEWLNWRQSHEPFSADTLEYIRSLDAEQDIALLRSNGLELPHLSARTLRISTMILKEGANRGLSPYDIGGILCREIYNKESVIEKILEEAYNLNPLGTEEVEFLKTVSGLLDVEFDKVSKKRL